MADDVLYLADQRTGLQILDVSDPAAPVLLGRLQSLGGIERVAVDDGRVFCACVDSTLHVVDVSDPATPLALGTPARRAHTR